MDYFLRSKTRGGIILPINPNLFRLISTIDRATDNGEDLLKILLGKAVEKDEKIPVTILLLRKQIPDIDKAWLPAYKEARMYIDHILMLIPESDVPRVRRALLERRYRILGDNIVID